MRLSLVGVAGPLAGTTLVVENGLAIGGACRIRAGDAGSFVAHAIARASPVFINGLPLTRRVLQPRDEIRVDESLFVVHADTTPVVDASVVPCTAVLADRPARIAFELSAEETMHTGSSGDETRDAHDLGALMRIGAALSSVQGLAALDPPVAALLMEALPAACVAFVGEDGAPPRSAWAASAESSGPLHIDAALIDRVMRSGAAAGGDCSRARGRSGQFLAAPIAAFGRPRGAIWVEARAGAGFDLAHARLLLAIAGLIALTRAHAREGDRLQAEREMVLGALHLDQNIVCRSRPMRHVLERIARVAGSDATVLVSGESGTGKELVARAIHRNSRRAAQPFVPINCAALTETLLESELFGHEKGAFTGAIGQKKGRLEIADGGTVFLDEIGEMPPGLQAKLLRAIQEREFERVGGTRPVRVDIRLIAATNRDLEAAVRAGLFRQDLYYRLNVVSIVLPPLRQRSDDIELLAHYLVRKHGSRAGRAVTGITADALTLLQQHEWPGNVRELENVIEQAVIMGSHDRIAVEDLPPGLAARCRPASPAASFHDALEQAKRDLIVNAFDRAGGSHTAAARSLGLHPNYLHRLVRNLQLRPALKGR